MDAADDDAAWRKGAPERFYIIKISHPMRERSSGVWSSHACFPGGDLSSSDSEFIWIAH